MTWPILRTDPRQTKTITNVDLFLGFAAVLIVVPIFAWIFVIILKRNGLALNNIFYSYFLVLTISPLLSWIGCIASIPLIAMSRRYGVFGFGSALAAGALMGTMAGVFLGGLGTSAVELIVFLMPAASTLGLTFWLVVRWRRPDAFRKFDPAQTARVFE